MQLGFWEFGVVWFDVIVGVCEFDGGIGLYYVFYVDLVLMVLGFDNVIGFVIRSGDINLQVRSFMM